VSNPIREHVFTIIKRVLQRDDISSNVDFFDLEATSLAIIQIVELVRKECDSEIWITDAFDAADIDAFADHVVAHVRSTAAAAE
jgi:acyl carrier protein